MKKHTRKTIAEGIERLQPWFHNIDLAGQPTDPQNPDHPRTRWDAISTDLPQDMQGKTVLDLGCASGYFALELAARGAHVLAVDWEERAVAQVQFAADVLELEVECRLQNIYAFVLANNQVFDYVLFMGVFYHLRHPLLVTDQLARMTREAMVFQTVLSNHEDTVDPELPDNFSDRGLLATPGFPALYFLERRFGGILNNWFVSNESAVRAMLRSSGFHDPRKRGEDCFVCLPNHAALTSDHPAWDLQAIRRLVD